MRRPHSASACARRSPANARNKAGRVDEAIANLRQVVEARLEEPIARRRLQDALAARARTVD